MGVNVSHRYTGFRDCNAVRIHSGLCALVQRGCKPVGLIGLFAPILLGTPVEKTAGITANLNTGGDITLCTNMAVEFLAKFIDEVLVDVFYLHTTS